MSTATLITEMHYLPCIAYINQLCQYNKVVFEIHEHFIKQSYRNRCSIYGANGKQDLIVPVVKKSAKIPIQDLQISYAQNWQHTHFMAIHSAYKSSPYYDYYEGEIRELFSKQEKYLLDHSVNCIEWIAKTLRINLDTAYSESYIHSYEGEGVTDARNTISPKAESKTEYPKYLQVFEEKHGFIPNLSIIDWIFNDLQGVRSYYASS